MSASPPGWSGTYVLLLEPPFFQSADKGTTGQSEKVIRAKFLESRGMEGRMGFLSSYCIEKVL